MNFPFPYFQKHFMNSESLLFNHYAIKMNSKQILREFSRKCSIRMQQQKKNNRVPSNWRALCCDALLNTADECWCCGDGDITIFWYGHHLIFTALDLRATTFFLQAATKLRVLSPHYIHPIGNIRIVA